MGKHLLTARSINIAMNNIKIDGAFRSSYPKPEKLSRTYVAMIEDKAAPTILIDENNTLIDGYTTYLVSKMLDKKKVRAVRVTIAQEPASHEPLENQVEKAMLKVTPEVVEPWDGEDEERLFPFCKGVDCTECEFRKRMNFAPGCCTDTCRAEPGKVRAVIDEMEAEQDG